MAAYSTKGTAIYLTKGSATVVDLTPTAITSAKPAQVTVANTLVNGDIVRPSNTGFKELDGKVFVVGSATATSFTLVGSDTTGSTGTLSASPVIHATNAADQVKLCLSSISIDASQASSLSVATFCDNQASISVPPSTAGTFTIQGYVDADPSTDAGYVELLKAVEDGKQRDLQIVSPNGKSFWICPVTVSAASWSNPVDGAAAFTFSGSLNSAQKHIF